MVEAGGCERQPYSRIFQGPYPGSMFSFKVYIRTIYTRCGPESFHKAAAPFRATMAFTRPFQTTLSGIQYLAHHNAVVSNTLDPGGPVVADLAEGRFGHCSGSRI